MSLLVSGLVATFGGVIAFVVMGPARPRAQRLGDGRRTGTGRGRLGPDAPVDASLLASVVEPSLSARTRIAARIRGGVMGSWRMRTPVASAIALAMAAGPQRTEDSPIPLAPNGPSGAGTSTIRVSIGGSADARGMA